MSEPVEYLQPFSVSIVIREELLLPSDCALSGVDLAIETRHGRGIIDVVESLDGSSENGLFGEDTR